MTYLDGEPLEYSHRLEGDSSLAVGMDSEENQ